MGEKELEKEQILETLYNIEFLLQNYDRENNFKPLNYSKIERINKAVEQLRNLEYKLLDLGVNR